MGFFKNGDSSLLWARLKCLEYVALGNEYISHAKSSFYLSYFLPKSEAVKPGYNKQ